MQEPSAAAASSPGDAGPGPDAASARLTVIGTGHVFRIGDAIHGAIEALRPDAVFVELDPGRLRALVARERGEEVTGGGFIHKRLERFQREVAASYGTQAGAEMLAAARAARATGARLHLIDPPAEDTLRRVIREMSWRERLGVVGQTVKGALGQLRPGRKARGKQQIEAEIARYQNDPAAVLEELADRFPTIHRVVIAERDEKMADAIKTALPGVRHGVVVLGDGHLNGVLERLAGVPTKVYRLADVRAGRLPVPAGSEAAGTADKVGFHFESRVWLPPDAFV